MSRLLQPLMIAVVMTLLGIGYQVKLNMLSNKLADTEAHAELLVGALKTQSDSITRLQREKQQAERLLKAQRLELQQLATDTKETQHAVQQHLAKTIPGRPNCNAERLPTAVISLLGTKANSGAGASADIATSGVNAPLP